MDFDLSKPQQLLQQSAREFLARECSHEKVRALMATETAYDENLWQGIADQGWTGIIIPEEFGGLGLGCVELAVVAEEMGRAVLPTPYLSTVWASALIASAQSDGQKAQYLEKIASGESKATVALLESSASWDLDAVSLAAQKNADGYVLSGTKEFVTDAGVADLLLVVAICDEELIVLAVPSDAAGVAIRATPGIDPTRKLYRVDFNQVKVNTQALIESGYRAKDAVTRSMAIGSVALCAEMVGGMQWVIDESVEYVKTRQQFGKPVGIYQAVQHKCADMLLFTESSRAAVYYAAWALQENDPSAKLAVSSAKVYCSDAARETGNRGIQVHGGIGFTWEHNLHLYYKRFKGSELMFGDPIFHREVIAKQIIDENE